MGGVVLIVLATGIAAIWIAQGRTDPPVAGRVLWSDHTLAWAGGPEITLSAGQYRWMEAPHEADMPGDVFTLDVQARFAADAGAGSAWGVWIETDDGARVLYAISGEGYTTTRNCERLASPPGPLSTPWRRGELAATKSPLHPMERGYRGEADACPALRPEWRWFAYPRIHPPGEPNLITLHVERTGEIRLRINHEIMGIAPVEWSGRWGIWMRGGRELAARLTWERASVRG